MSPVDEKVIQDLITKVGILEDRSQVYKENIEAIRKDIHDIKVEFKADLAGLSHKMVIQSDLTRKMFDDARKDIKADMYKIAMLILAVTGALMALLKFIPTLNGGG